MTANWFEAKISYMKVCKDGREKKVKESYLLDAISYTEGEARIIKQMESVIKGEYFLTSLKKSNITELITSNDETDDRWYKAKISIIDADERSGQEKSSSQYYLIAAGNINKALANLEESLSSFVVPYEIVSLSDTDFMDVFPYFSDENEEIPENLIPLKEMSSKQLYESVAIASKMARLKKFVENKIQTDPDVKNKHLEIKGIIETQLPMFEDNPLKVALSLVKEYQDDSMIDLILGTAAIMCNDVRP